MEQNRNRIITFVGVLAISASLLTIGTPAVWAAERDYDETRDAKANGVVYVENITGSIEVQGWEKNQVHVSGTLGNDVKEVEFKTSGKKTRIEVVYPRKIRNIDEGADLVIMVPRGSRVEVECVSAPVTVSAVEGRIYASSISGDVTVEGGEDEVQAETISGNVEVRSEATKIAVESISGRVSAKGDRAAVEASVVNGRVDLEFDVFTDCSLETVNGSAHVTGDFTESADCDIDIHSGNVILTVPADLKADFEVNTFSGGIDNAFGKRARKTSKYTPGRELEFSTGGGGAQIRINTFSGSVEIRKM
ncbi:MAG: DUF4097 domain-containing protein [bacterium]|nr:DUF4097 domain-containing protein [bacterium]